VGGWSKRKTVEKENRKGATEKGDKGKGIKEKGTKEETKTERR
jgi:hypothetical protein